MQDKVYDIYADGQYEHCTIGLTEKAAGKLGMTHEDRENANAVIVQHLKLEHGIPSWNDATGRTKEQVRAALVATAKALRNDAVGELTEEELEEFKEPALDKE